MVPARIAFPLCLLDWRFEPCMPAWAVPGLSFCCLLSVHGTLARAASCWLKLSGMIGQLKLAAFDLATDLPRRALCTCHLMLLAL